MLVPDLAPHEHKYLVTILTSTLVNLGITIARLTSRSGKDNNPQRAGAGFAPRVHICMPLAMLTSTLEHLSITLARLTLRAVEDKITGHIGAIVFSPPMDINIPCAMVTSTIVKPSIALARLP